MAAKSIVEIDVKDESFQAFLEAFKGYQEALNNMPAGWRNAGAEAAKTEKVMDGMAEDAEGMARGTEETVQGFQQLLSVSNNVSFNIKSASNSQNELRRGAGSASDLLSRGAKSAKSMAGDIKDATLSLLKWGSVLGIFSGLVGGGGLFGINRLAQSASLTRFTAQGLGTSAGGLNSVAVNYQRALGDPVSTLGNIRDVQADLSRRWAFEATGIKNPSADPAKILPELIKNSRDIFAQSGSTLQGAEAHGLTQFFTIDDLNRFQKMSNAEIDSMAKRAEADSQQMQMSDDLLRKWQDFDVQLDRSGTSIRTTFITGLAPLAPQLEHVSEAFSNLLNSVLRSPKFAQWIDSAADGLEKFGKYLDSPEFEEDARRFAEVLEGLIRAVGGAASWIASKFGGAPAAGGASGYQLPDIAKHDDKATYGPSGLDSRSWLAPIADKMADDVKESKRWSEMSKRPVSERNNNPLNLRWAPGAGKQDGFAKFDDDGDGFSAAARQLLRYADGTTFGKPVDTVRGIISKWAPPQENDTESYIKNVVNRTGFKENQRLDLNDSQVLSKLLAAMAKQENSRSNYSPEGINLIVRNDTGGNAVVSGAQLGGQ